MGEPVLPRTVGFQVFWVSRYKCGRNINNIKNKHTQKGFIQRSNPVRLLYAPILQSFAVLVEIIN